ncbi:peroxisomal acyl-coenzyme A oxidase 1-like [Montipora foliosa]|uniref:peroxisomal acyl-coenzyme A oxidase 1-like n=1 Tax=Montipora foliosa TaxID=591990 RepID=UPI0035F17B37
MATSAANVNPDLAREREKASFNPTELTYLIYGGREKTERKRYLESLLLTDPVLNNDDSYVLDRSRIYERSCQKSMHLLELVKKYNITNEEEITILERSSGTIAAYGLSKSMFIPTIKSQGTEEQKAKWLPLAESLHIIGTYAQTELGHGSNVRGLETTATYDKETQEFVIHSPTLSACKWWPGNMGKSSNFATVPARLILEGKDHGIQMFIVQLRDRKTHQPMPGITIGDIGPKFGFNGVDNGFLMFDHVRIPLNQMLMGLSKLSPDGTLTKPVNSKLMYGTMSKVRVGIVWESFWFLSKAITIAVRYSAVRRQNHLKPGEQETQVIDYKTQQYKLLPGLATAYAFRFAFHHMKTLHQETQKKISLGDLSTLTEFHAITCGLKAFCTAMALRHTETCRLACGGHGYLLCSAIPDLYTLSNASCTYEGDNDVLYLQVARFLMKVASKVRRGEALSPSLSFFSRTPQQCVAVNGNEFLDPRVQAKIYEDRTLSEVKTVGEMMQNKIISGMDLSLAQNELSVDLVHCAKHYSHCIFIFLLLKSVENLSGISLNLHHVLKCLIDLTVLYGIAENSGSFLEVGVLNGHQIQIIRQQIYSLMDELRPEAVCLVDAFDYSDYVLNSALGRFDGNVYEDLFKRAQASSLNKHQVPPAYYKFLHPLMNNQKSKL